MTRVMRRSLDELRRSVRSEEPVDVHEARGLLMSPSRQMRLSRMRSIADLQLPMPWKTRGAKNVQEREAVVKFKEEIRRARLDIPSAMCYSGDVDATLLRFLRARKLNVDKALKMLRDTLQWRAAENVNQILTEIIPQWKLDRIRLHSRGAQLGFDKLGRPVYLDRPGFLDVDAILKNGVSTDDFLRKHVRDMEYVSSVLMWQASQKVGRTVDQTLTVIDATNVTLGKLTKTVRDTFAKLTQIDQNNYPETLGATIILNAGWVFSSVFKVIATFLDQHTREKIQMLGSSKKDLAVLQSFLDLDQIPACIGGNLPDEAVWDDKGLTAEDQRLDEECRRRARLVAAGATLEVANLPPLVREMGAKGSLRVCSVETARDEGVVTFAVSAACMDLIKEELRFSEESQPLLYGLDEEEEISMTPKIIPVMSNNTINRMLSHEGLGRLDKEELDPEVLLTIARVDRIVAKANEIKKERSRVRDLAERILEIDSP